MALTLASRSAATVCLAAILAGAHRASRWWRDVYLPAIFLGTNCAATAILRDTRAASGHDFLPVFSCHLPSYPSFAVDQYRLDVVDTSDGTWPLVLHVRLSMEHHHSSRK